VALAESQRAAAQAALNFAEARVKTSMAIYRQIIGDDPHQLRTPRGVDYLAPRNIQEALNIAFGEHPAILATQFLVDQADWGVKRAESDLLPTLSLEGTVARGYDRGSDFNDSDSASVIARLRVPIYQGGRVSATVRQRKEVLGQRRIEVDQTVDNVRAAVFSAYSELESAKASVEAGIVQERAAKLGLEGTVEERKVGQRTTLDVLRSQQDVIDAQVTLSTSRRDVIVAGYAVLSAIGRLSPDRLKLAVVDYDPIEHYEIVKDKWFGLRTPDGR
jgi:outer membrane protein